MTRIKGHGTRITPIAGRGSGGSGNRRGRDADHGTRIGRIRQSAWAGRGSRDADHADEAVGVGGTRIAGRGSGGSGNRRGWDADHGTRITPIGQCADGVIHGENRRGPAAWRSQADGVGTRRDPHAPCPRGVWIPARPHPTRASGAAGPNPPRDPRLVGGLREIRFSSGDAARSASRPGNPRDPRLVWGIREIRVSSGESARSASSFASLPSALRTVSAQSR
jgi:hypothetical protein